MRRTTLGKTAAFTASKLTSTVFKIVEYDDIYSEHPFIYAKVLSDVIILIDSGCGGASNDSTIDVKSLREFVETWSVADNDGQPLNKNGARKYVVVCTHCHYDHILALEQFSEDSQILASSHCPSFLAPKNLPQNTQCKRLKIPVPKYTPTLVDHESLIIFNGKNTGLQILHTPGHTPDELALWDAKERMLYVGDTVYEWEPILFPPEGDIVQWFATMDYLIDFVTDAECSAVCNPVKINAGHDTSMVNALDVLQEGKAFLADVISGKERVKKRTTVDGVKLVSYARMDGRFSLRCPERLVLDARERLPKLRLMLHSTLQLCIGSATYLTGKCRVTDKQAAPGMCQSSPPIDHNHIFENMLRLSGLRGDARTLVAMEESMRRRKKSAPQGVVECQSKSKPAPSVITYSTSRRARSTNSVSSTTADRKIEAIFMDAVRRANTRTFLLPRPRYIYGDVYAPVYQPCPEDEVRRAPTREIPKLTCEASRKRCKACVENSGRACIRSKASPRGSALGKNTIVMRALRASPTERDASTMMYSPGPSPLRSCLRPDYVDDLSDQSTDSTRLSSTSALPREGQPRRTELEAEAGEDEEWPAHGMLSASFARMNMSQIFEALDESVMTYVEGPFLPDRDEIKSSESQDKSSAASREYSILKDDGQRPTFGSQTKHDAPAKKRVTFAEHPPAQRKLAASGNLDICVQIHRATDRAWRRARSFGSSFLRGRKDILRGKKALLRK
ncbi:hypothetical protein ACEPAF_8676 [Sanghuangporus sanghuang]